MSKEIETFIHLFNESWVKGKYDQLDNLLDEGLIFVAPNLETEINGKEKCIQTLIDYGNYAETKVFEVVAQKINSWGTTAMVALDYYIEYEANQQLSKEKGKEFWTLRKQNGKWLLVWRAMVKNEAA